MLKQYWGGSMKLILVWLFLIIGCNSETTENKVQYLTNGYLCESVRIASGANIVYNCENVLTGQKQEKIYNATNIVEVK